MWFTSCKREWAWCGCSIDAPQDVSRLCDSRLCSDMVTTLCWHKIDDCCIVACVTVRYCALAMLVDVIVFSESAKLTIGQQLNVNFVLGGTPCGLNMARTLTLCKFLATYNIRDVFGQIIKALLMNDTHADDDVELVAEDLEELLSEAVDSESLQAAAEEYGHPQRHLVYSDGCTDVVDSFIGSHWQRCHRSDPSLRVTAWR